MRIPIYIFSLAEKETFYQVLYNFLGWAPEPTNDTSYHMDESIALIQLLNKVRESNGEIRIRHLFRTFTAPAGETERNQHILDAEFLLRHLLSLTVFPVRFELDSDDTEDQNDCGILAKDNPTLYDRLMEHMSITAANPLDFKATLSLKELETVIRLTAIEDKKLQESINKANDEKKPFIAGSYLPKKYGMQLLLTKLLTFLAEAKEIGGTTIKVTIDGDIIP